MPFRDRIHAAEMLAAKLRPLRTAQPLVLAVPRGAVPMGRVLAEALGGDLDVVLVRKLGAPGNPELAVGSLTEDGTIALNEVARHLGVSREYVDEEVRRQRAVLAARRRALEGHAPVDPRGRTVVVVDDGVATGSTMLAAIDALRKRDPARIVVATGVAAPQALRRLRAAADEVVCLECPEDFAAVGEFFDDFSPVTDDEVVAILRAFREGRGRTSVTIRDGTARIEGDLTVPAGAAGVVLFAHGSGSSRKSPRNRFVAGALQRAGFATLLLDLLTPEEDADPEARFDIGLLSRRLVAAARWLAARRDTGPLALGLFGASTGAACALRAAAALPEHVRTVVSRGGRPDLAGNALDMVQCPVLLIVGGDDVPVAHLNRAALARIPAEPKRLEVIAGATHLFEEAGALERVAELAAEWFAARLPRARARS